MKKLLLSLGALSAVVAPVAAVVACGSTTETHEIADKTIAAQRATITASKASQALKDAALTELAKVKDAKGLVAFYKTEAFKAYTAAVTTATNAAPVVKEAADLELGNLLSTDLAKNISKTDTVLEDQAKAFVAKVVAGPIATVSFKLDDGELITFDFGTDSFLHNGNEADDNGTIDTGADTVVTFGEYANYISDKLSASFKLEDGKLAAVKTDVNDAAFIKDAKFLIRMIVAAKTNLHYVSNKAWLLA